MSPSTDGSWPTPRAGKTTDEDAETWLRRQAAGKVATPPLTLAVKLDTAEPRWQTPTASDGQPNGRAEEWRAYEQGGSTRGARLRNQVMAPAEVAAAADASLPRNWLTPTTSDDRAANMASTQIKPGLMHSVSLGKAVQMDWPTPTASTWKGSGPKGSKSQVKRLEKHYLDAVVEEVEGGPTPADADGQAAPPECAPGRLNPDWVETLMGLPVGWTNPDVTMTAADCLWPAEIDGGNFLDAYPWPAGPGQQQHDWEPPRVTLTAEHRQARLKTLGNGVVVACGELLGRIIVEADRRLFGEGREERC